MDCQVQILPEVLQDPRPPFLLSCPPSIVAGCQASLYAARLPDATLHSYQQAVRCRQQLWVSICIATYLSIELCILIIYLLHLSMYLILSIISYLLYLSRIYLCTLYMYILYNHVSCLLACIFYLSIHLSTYIYPFIYLSIYLSLYMYVYDLYFVICVSNR